MKGRGISRKWLTWDRENDICPKVIKMGCLIGQRRDYNEVEVLRGQRHIRSKNWPKYPHLDHPISIFTHQRHAWPSKWKGQSPSASCWKDLIPIEGHLSEKKPARLLSKLFPCFRAQYFGVGQTHVSTSAKYCKNRSHIFHASLPGVEAE